LVKCPLCGGEVSNASKEWDFSVFHIKRFYCGACQKAFNAYYRAGQLVRTVIPRSSK